MIGENLSEFDKTQLALQRLDIEAVMGSEHGRRFIWRILQYCGIYRDIEGDRDDMLKQLGNRQTGLYILGIISDVCEDQVFQMMKEAKNQALMEEEYYDNRNNNAGNYPDTDTADHTGKHYSDARDIKLGNINVFL